MIPQQGRSADAILAFFYRLLRFLPTETASNIGGHGYRLNAKLSLPEARAKAKANLKIHKPGASEPELDAMVMDFYDHVGRVAAEFAVMDRIMKEGRITHTGLEPFAAAFGKEPLILLCVHTGNWEVLPSLFKTVGIQLASIVQPPNSAFERQIVRIVRQTYDVETIEPDLRGIRRAIAVLKARRTVSIFPDEARDGVAHGPLFGRPPHERGNLAIAARLSRMTGARILFSHCRRILPCRFHVEIEGPFSLPDGGERDILADVAFLNSKIEPVILNNLPRWYFLDDRIDPISA